MNNLQFIAGLALSIASFASYAGNPNSAPDQAGAHPLTRSEVRAELVRARLAGELGTLGDSPRSFEMSAGDVARTSVTRDQVMAELSQARHDGNLTAANDVYGANLNLGRTAPATSAAVVADVHLAGRDNTGAAAKK
jgi:Domain of unknown function (DUF4148)